MLHTSCVILTCKTSPVNFSVNFVPMIGVLYINRKLGICPLLLSRICFSAINLKLIPSISKKLEKEKLCAVIFHNSKKHESTRSINETFGQDLVKNYGSQVTVKNIAQEELKILNSTVFRHSKRLRKVKNIDKCAKISKVAIHILFVFVM